VKHRRRTARPMIRRQQHLRESETSTWSMRPPPGRYRGTIQCGARNTRVHDVAWLAANAAQSNADFPAPITTTRRPLTSAGSVNSLEWSTALANDSRPAMSGTYDAQHGTSLSRAQRTRTAMCIARRRKSSLPANGSRGRAGPPEMCTPRIGARHRHSGASLR
jgi:hypothetical protein